MVGVRVAFSTNRSGLLRSVFVLTSARGLFALLTDIERATPTIALPVISLPAPEDSVTLRLSLARPADSGGLRMLEIRCRGEGASRGADAGLDDKAQNFVTLGRVCESCRAIAGAEDTLDLIADRLVHISHSGSPSSR